jgi:hypothetical protein
MSDTNRRQKRDKYCGTSPEMVFYHKILKNDTPAGIPIYPEKKRTGLKT